MRALSHCGSPVAVAELIPDFYRIVIQTMLRWDGKPLTHYSSCVIDP